MISPSRTVPDVPGSWMFGTSFTANGPSPGGEGSRELPSSSIGAVLHNASALLLLPDALHTVMSLSANVLVSDSAGSVPDACNVSSSVLLTMNVPYSPLNTWLVEE